MFRQKLERSVLHYTERLMSHQFFIQAIAAADVEFVRNAVNGDYRPNTIEFMVAVISMKRSRWDDHFDYSRALEIFHFIYGHCSDRNAIF